MTSHSDRPEEYLLLGVAVRCAQRAGTLDLEAPAQAHVVYALSRADAERQALPWLLEALPPAFGWQGHTVRATALAELRPGIAQGDQ